MYILQDLSPMEEELTKVLEVTCIVSGKIRRFAAGTNAGDAVNSINRRLSAGAPPACSIEAVKEGEESVTFGTNSVLVDYGPGWKLQTVVEKHSKNVIPAQRMEKPTSFTSPNSTFVEHLQHEVAVFITIYVFAVLIIATVCIFVSYLS